MHLRLCIYEDMCVYDYTCVCVCVCERLCMTVSRILSHSVKVREVLVVTYKYATKHLVLSLYL